MKPDRQETRLRYEENRRLGRELAGRLGREAELIAATLEHLATVHDSMVVTGHPLADDAAGRAEAERAMAAREREASAWFRSLAGEPDA